MMTIAHFLNALLSRFDKKALKQLDGWRGFLAFIVVVAHANQIFIVPIIGENNYTNWGFGVAAHFAVLGFFIISGIAITMSLLLNLIRNKNQLDFREYTLARISRIHPPLIFSILLCVGFYVVMRGFNLSGINYPFRLEGDLYVARQIYDFNLHDIFTTLTFQSASLVKINGPLWSLIIEWWIYFLALVFVGFFFVKSYLKKLFLIIIFALIFNKLKELDGLVYLVLWILGSVYYLFGKKYHVLIMALLILSLLGLFVTNYYIRFFENMTDLSTQAIVQILFGFCFIGLISKFPVKTFFNNMSQYSYTIYIIHFPFFLFVFSVFHKSTQGILWLNILISIVSIAMILFVASKIYRVIENKKKFTVLLNRFIDKINQKLSFIYKS